MKAMLNKFERFKEKKVQDLHTFLRKKMRKGKVKKRAIKQHSPEIRGNIAQILHYMFTNFQ